MNLTKRDTTSPASPLGERVRRILTRLSRRPDSRRQQRWKLLAESFSRHR